MPDKRDEATIKSEFLIFKIEKNPKINNTYKFLGLFSTLKKATDAIESLNPNEIGRIVIVEKKAYYDRRPAITLSSLEENILTE